MLEQISNLITSVNLQFGLAIINFTLCKYQHDKGNYSWATFSGVVGCYCFTVGVIIAIQNGYDFLGLFDFLVN